MPSSDATRASSDAGVPRRRGSRRASAPATAAVAPGVSETPDADWGAWLRADEDEKRAQPPSGTSGTDRWYLEQRPPHWG